MKTDNGSQILNRKPEILERSGGLFPGCQSLYSSCQGLSSKCRNLPSNCQGLFFSMLVYEWPQSALDPAGPQAGRISRLWWLMLIVCTAVFILVIAALIYSVVRAHRRNSIADEPAAERRMTRAVSGATIATLVILFGLLVASVLTGKAISSQPDKDVLTINVVGHQWWWEVTYEDPVAARTLKTANEIHIPVGQVVMLKLTSRDVIHSFWAPNLHGKKDLIPGHLSTMWIQADKPGVFRGQCAEFCGHQHAHMAFMVIAEAPDEFAQWYDKQILPAQQPADSVQARGQQVFLASSCVMCHTIRGTQASATVAPDLTHLASRQTIAAGTLANTRGHLAGWIVDSQQIKPGNRMPPNNLSSEDLLSLLSYLDNLN
jgi:cytochrome c oxidase subunit 2